MKPSSTIGLDFVHDCAHFVHNCVLKIVAYALQKTSSSEVVECALSRETATETCS